MWKLKMAIVMLASYTTGPGTIDFSTEDEAHSHWFIVPVAKQSM